MRLLALAIAICTAVSTATGYVDTTWVNRHDGPASGDDAGMAIALHPQGVVVAGRHMTTAGQSDFVTMLYDAAGRRQWISTYDGSGNGTDEARAVATDAAGNVYVAGPSQGDGTGYDFLTVKYNPSGVEQWVKRLDYEGNDDSPNALAVDNDGNVYVTGFGRGDATDQDWVTVKYDAGGTGRWRRFHDGDMYLYDEAFGIELDATGNIYAVGQSSFPGAYQLDYAVIKYSPAGETILVAEYDGGSYRFDNAYAMVLDDSGKTLGSGKYPPNLAEAYAKMEEGERTENLKADLQAWFDEHYPKGSQMSLASPPMDVDAHAFKRDMAKRAKAMFDAETPPPDDPDTTLDLDEGRD